MFDLLVFIEPSEKIILNVISFVPALWYEMVISLFSVIFLYPKESPKSIFIAVISLFVELKILSSERINVVSKPFFLILNGDTIVSLCCSNISVEVSVRFKKPCELLITFPFIKALSVIVSYSLCIILKELYCQNDFVWFFLLENLMKHIYF